MEATDERRLLHVTQLSHRWCKFCAAVVGGTKFAVYWVSGCCHSQQIKSEFRAQTDMAAQCAMNYVLLAALTRNLSNVRNRSAFPVALRLLLHVKKRQSQGHERFSIERQAKSLRVSLDSRKSLFISHNLVPYDFEQITQRPTSEFRQTPQSSSSTLRRRPIDLRGRLVMNLLCRQASKSVQKTCRNTLKSARCCADTTIAALIRAFIVVVVATVAASVRFADYAPFRRAVR